MKFFYFSIICLFGLSVLCPSCRYGVSTSLSNEQRTSTRLAGNQLHTPTPTQKPTPTITPTAYVGPVKIYGYVKDNNDNPVDMNIMIEGSNIGYQGSVSTDTGGYYEMQLPYALQFIVSIGPNPDQQIGRYSFPANYLPQRKLVDATAAEIKVDFIVVDGGVLWLKAYTTSGIEMMTQDFLDTSKVGAYPVGVFPYGESIQAKHDSFPLYWGWVQNSNKNIPCLILPSNEPVEIWVLWRLPEVGTTFIHADNDGLGFTTNLEEVTSINLIFETARTEYRKTVNQFQALIDLGYLFTDPITALLDSAQQNLLIAQNYQKGGSDNTSAVYSYKVLTQVIKAREQYVLERAQQDIENNRKGNVTVTLSDEQGNAFSNATIHYQQISHDFIISAGWPSPDNYATLHEAGFEYSLSESWWGQVEINDGEYRFPDASIEEQEKAGFGYIMKTGIWLMPNYPPAIPGFVKTMSPEELSSQIYQYNFDYVTHYLDRIRLYQILGEPEYPQAYPFTLQELIDIIKSSNLGVKNADSSLPTYILIAHPFFKSFFVDNLSYSVVYDQFGSLITGAKGYPSPINSGYELLIELKSNGVDFQSIGLEYAFGAPFPSIDLGIYANSLDFYSSLNKEVFIDEIFYPTLEEYPEVEKWWEFYGGWHQGFTNAVQAEWASSTLTIAFSKPNVIGYDWSTTRDGPTDYYLVGTGLFRRDGVTPRPVLNAIKDLIGSWTTAGVVEADEDGRFSFRGYAGEYELTITTEQGRTYHSYVHVSEQQDNLQNLMVDTIPPKIQSVSIEPKDVKNGETFQIKVQADESELLLAVDVSMLDSTQPTPIPLNEESSGFYVSEVTISVLNTFVDGMKTLNIYAIDKGGNETDATININLGNPPSSVDLIPPNDDFGGTTINGTKWVLDTVPCGEVTQNDTLIFKTSGTVASCITRVLSTWQLMGDFDVQVNFQSGADWHQPSNDHIDTAFLGVHIEGQGYQIARQIRSTDNNQELFYAWSSAGNLNEEISTSALSGILRLIRVGTNLTLLYNTGEGWQVLSQTRVPAKEAQVYFGNASINASLSFTTYFDDFLINSGITTYRP